jgi:hypothetical protein
MEQRIDRLSGRRLRIDEITKIGELAGVPLEEKRHIVELVIENGKFETTNGEVDIFVCPMSNDHQKLILKGAVPTIKKRGIPGVFPESGRRRVVSVPVFDEALSSPPAIRHEAGPNKIFQFQVQQAKGRR